MTAPVGSEGVATGARLSAVAEIVRRHDPDRFLTSLFAPVEKREGLLVLYAFNHELARAREVASLPMLALIRLQWWREVVEGARRSHEVATPVRDALDAGILDAGDLEGLIAGREMEAEAEGFATRADFEAYLDATAGRLAVAAGRVMGMENPWRLRALGRAYGLAGQLRNVGALARRELCVLPEEALLAHGLTAHEVMADPRKAAPVARAMAAEGLAALQGQGPWPANAAGLVGVLGIRDLRRLRDGRPQAAGRGVGDKLAVAMAYWRGRIISPRIIRRPV